MLNCVYFPKALQKPGHLLKLITKPDLFPARQSRFASISTFAIVCWRKKILKVKGVIHGEDTYDKSQMLEHQIIADVRYCVADSCAPLNEEYTD